MKPLKEYWQQNSRPISWTVLAAVVLGFLMLYKLGSLTRGLSIGEVHVSTAVVGWHGIYHAPLDLPLKLLRSIIFKLDPTHGQTLTRLPNAIFGAATIIAFGVLIWLWNGRRTALYGSALFATSAWVLHVSRYASFDVLYLWSIVTLLLAHTLLNRYTKYPVVWFCTLLFWSVCLTIPGLVWFILAELVMQRKALGTGWTYFKGWWERLLSVVAFILFMPIMVIDFARHTSQISTWLGFPSHFASIPTIIKDFGAVFVHLFVRGPLYSNLWLGREPILDAFTLAMSALGIYFYASRWQSTRSKLLETFFVIGAILVALNGPVGLSALIPLLYVAAAMGIAYFIHEWLQVFPLNPLARGIGIGIIAVAIAISCLYNVRSYFVAWAHNPDTISTFRYHR